MYPQWTNSDVWGVCLRMLESDAPLPNLKSRLQPYREMFFAATEAVRSEHARFLAPRYRSADKKGIVNPLYLEHYARLLYRFSRDLYVTKSAPLGILDVIFLSLKTRCCIDMFYEFDLKECFLPSHAFGTVLGRAKYGKHFIITQGCTIGNNKGIYPTFGDGVLMWPHSMVIGDCHIGNNVEIAAGALIIDTDVPDNMTVFGERRDLVFNPYRGNITEEYFEID